ncbi:MAG: ROK family protein [Verrucomicrobia bacterium]|nr:ROK family protein [Verrucomicrobiota bacterium]
MNNFIGIEIGGTKLQLVAGGADGIIRERRRFDVERARGGEGIREQIAQALPELARATKPRALGVGFGGPVDSATGKICRSHQIEGWSEFALGAWLKSLTGLPVAVDNDANVAALGEALGGAGKSFNPVFYVTLGSGVGGGLVVDGRIYHGAKPGESEIGHVRLDRSGTIVESRCSGWAVDRKIRERAAGAPGSRLAKLISGTGILPVEESGSMHLGALEVAGASTDRRDACPTTAASPGGEARFLAAALQQGDKLAREILDEVAEDLAFGLSHVTQLLHPEVIILGGGLSLVGEPLRAAVQAALGRFVMEVFLPGPRVLLAGLGEDAVPVGALKLAGAASA